MMVLTKQFSAIRMLAGKKHVDNVNATRRCTPLLHAFPGRLISQR